jgi:sugar/nucleoside kinase (ribokinase family)
VPGVDVCVVGEINLDLILYGVPERMEAEKEILVDGAALTLGSSSAIFAHNLSALGSRVVIASKIGADPLGQIALNRLREAGVDIAPVRVTKSGTATGLTVILTHPSHRFILTYPGTMFEMKYADLDLDYILTARHLHVSSFFLHWALRPQLWELFREAKKRGMSTSLDTNDDPADE